jgi:hypothetical protein
MMRLTLPELGNPTDPGRYDSRYGVIEVTADDLWIWTQHPNAAFVVMQPSPYSEKTYSWLGTFELREG